MKSITSIFDNFKRELGTVNIWKAGIIFLVLAVLFSFSSITIADPDLWGHLRFGLDILESGSIPKEDTYSYLTKGQNWINHEWLAEYLFASVWVLGESAGLILLKTVVTSLTFGLIYWWLVKKDFNPVRGGILLILVLIMLWSFILPVRPQIFTILFFAILLFIIVNAENGKYHYLWAAPIILALWANLHGGFLAGLGVLLLWFLMHFLFHKENWMSILPPVLVSCLSFLLNPYGLDLITFLLRTATESRLDISDWQPISIRSLPGILYLSLVVISLLGLVYSKHERKPVLVILYLVICVLPLLAFRHIQLFSAGVLLLAGEHVFSAWNRFWKRSKTEFRLKSLISAIPFIAGLLILIAILPRNLSQITIPSAVHPFPFQVKELLKNSDVEGNLVVIFNWGEYIIWHLGPEVKVSMDGRRETVYSEDIYQEYLDFHHGTGDWDAVLTKHETDMALVRKSTATFNLMMLNQDWELVYEDDFSALFAPIGSEISRIIQQTSANEILPEEKDTFP